MHNHLKLRALPFRVTVGCTVVAAFANYLFAMQYGQKLGAAEVHAYYRKGDDRNGIIAQFRDGALTPEFEHLAKYLAPNP